MKHLIFLLFFSLTLQASYISPGSSSGAATTTVDQVSGFIETPTNTTYVLDAKARFAYTINSFFQDMTSGTQTVAIKINGTDVTGLSSVSCSSSSSDTSATAANSVAVGDRVTMVVTSVSSPVGFEFNLKYTR